MALSPRMLALAGAILLGTLSASMAETASGTNDQPYFYYQDGVRAGPIALGDLIAMANDGRLSTASFVWTRGLEQWVRADQVAALSGEFMPTLPEEPIYYVSDHGVRIGPLTQSDLGARIIAGQIGPHDLVWTIGGDGWIEVAHMEVLQPFIPPELPPEPEGPEAEPQPQGTSYQSLQTIIGALFDEEFPDAGTTLRAEFTMCIITAVKPLGHDVHQRLIETQFHLPEAERTQLEADHPGLAERINGCSEIVEGSVG